MPWVKAQLRGQTVFARVNEAGSFLIEDGRVEIRYKPNDGRLYRAKADGLTMVDAKLLPEDTCSDASPVSQNKPQQNSPPNSAAPALAVQSQPSPRPSTMPPPSSKIPSLMPYKPGASSPPGPLSSRTGPASSPPSSVSRTSNNTTTTASSNSSPKTGSAPSNETPGFAFIAYADGACSGTPGPAGLGVLFVDGRDTIELSEYLGSATNNIAELTAILRAIEFGANKSGKMLIYTDSQYSIGVLTKDWKAKANTELVAKLRKAIKERGDVELRYVKGHAGIDGNEKADELARMAITTRGTTCNKLS